MTKSTGFEAARIQFGVCIAFDVAVSDTFVISGRTLGMKFEQPLLGIGQIRQTEKRMRLRRVLDRSARARLLSSKDVVGDLKQVLNLRSNTSLELFELLAHPFCLSFV